MLLRRIVRRVVRRSTRFPWIVPAIPRPLTVRMDTTNRCNLRCSMCPMRLSDMDPDRVWMDMEDSLFGRIASEIFPRASSVSLSCGAEPLCNPSFPSHLEALYRADVPCREMVTNGLLLSGERLDAVLGHPPTTLTVSIDGASEETHAAIRGGCDLGVVRRNLQALATGKKSRGRSIPHVAFSTTLQRRNLKELPGIVALAADCGAETVNVNLLVPYEGLGMSGEAVDPADPLLADSMDRAGSAAKGLGIGLHRAGSASPGPCCRYSRSWVFIAPDGKVFPCPYWNLGDPVGDLSVSSFRDVRRGAAWSRLRARLTSGVYEGVCSSCPEIEGSGRGEISKVDLRGSCSARGSR